MKKKKKGDFKSKEKLKTMVRQIFLGGGGGGVGEQKDNYGIF